MNKKTLSGIRALRSIHLIDIENLCATPKLSEQIVQATRAEYLNMVRPGFMDQYIVTVSTKRNLLAAKLGWPNSRVLSKEGKDGADLLIAEELMKLSHKDAYRSIYLASGDGGLAAAAEGVLKQGKILNVVSIRPCLSRKFKKIGAPIMILRQGKPMVP